MSRSPDDGTFKHLLEFWLVVTTVRVHVVSLHVRSVYRATECWVCVAISVRVKCRFTEISRYRRVRQPSAGKSHTFNFLIDVFPLLS